MPEPNVSMGDLNVTGSLKVNGVEIGTDVSGLGALYAMAIARMRGANPDNDREGVIGAAMDTSIDPDLKVTQATSPNMTVKVGSGTCIVAGIFTGIGADGSVTVVAPTGTHPRITIIQINQSGTLSAKNGTQAASPVAPSPDAGNLTLAEIEVAVGQTSIVNADITDTRTFI